MLLQHLGVVGYGEVGRIFSAGLRAHFQSTQVWDLKLADGTLTRGAMHAQTVAAQVTPVDGVQALCAQSDFIISAVTASNTLAVAEAVAPHLRAGTVFLDLNSASPGTKQQAAKLIEAAGGRYVEAGVMTSVPPYGIKVPMLFGGPLAAELAVLLNAMGMDAKAVATEIGVASAIKMCRSVMIKGLEALVIESYSTARAYGVEDHVLPTLAETFPSIDWEKQGAYFFSRVVQHGQRRAEEMRESARTVSEAGFAPTMASAIADKQQWVADQARTGLFADVPKDAPWQDYADRLLKK
ncbi:dehydrogenase [Rhodoferax saidenbachensis]|uniref:Dehydrogenase n=1 Tax=Rhodoferax saidenbachensis TaxID=1484693 RepID=A0A1P8KFL6_9BURK|nr:NAD(P)-dependent oxidoreductase [Rhodoferax saidenbachensis]APW44857.1 dehydrogenase [Rhodoferax saidenbachensis]